MAIETQRVQIATRHIGEFQLDAVVNENHESTLNITENPIETGEPVSDHAFMSPRQVSIAGIVVNYEPPAATASLPSTALTLLRSIPLPAQVQTLTSQALSLASRLVSQTSQAQEEVQRVIAPFLPNFKNTGQDSSQTLDRIQKAYSDLLALQRRAELIEIQTGVSLYTNMALLSVNLMQTDDGSAELQITAREVFIVQTQTAGGLEVQNAPGRAGTQGATVSSKGNTQPESVISWGIGVFK